MNPAKHSRVVVGTVLVIVGIVFILMNIGVVGHVPFFRFWPLIIVVIGLNKLLQADSGHGRWEGVWMLLLGAWFQMVTLHAYGMTYRNSWPLLLIVWGIYLAGSAIAKKSPVVLPKENINGN